MADKHLLTAAELAEYLSVSREQIYKLIQRRNLPRYDCNCGSDKNCWRFDLDEVLSELRRGMRRDDGLDT